MLIHISDEKFFNFLKVFSKNAIVYKKFVFLPKNADFSIEKRFSMSETTSAFTIGFLVFSKA